MLLRKIGIDCNITLEESSLYVSTRMPLISTFTLRLIFELLNFSHLFLRHLEFHFTEGFGSNIFLFLSPLLDSLELYNISGFEDTVLRPFLASLLSSRQMLRRFVLRSGRMPADILKKCFVQFKQLRSVELSNAALMTDFSLWKALGTLPSLKNFTVEVDDPESHPAHAPENSNGQSGGLRYFDAL